MKIAKEMVTFNKNVMNVSLKDIHKHSQVLSEKVKNDYYGIYSSFSSAFRTFMAENVDSTSGREYYLIIDLDQQT